MEKLKVEIRVAVVTPAIAGDHDPLVTIGSGREVDQGVVNVHLVAYRIFDPPPGVGVVVHFVTATEVVVHTAIVSVE